MQSANKLATALLFSSALTVCLVGVISYVVRAGVSQIEDVVQQVHEIPVGDRQIDATAARFVMIYVKLT